MQIWTRLRPMAYLFSILVIAFAIGFAAPIPMMGNHGNGECGEAGQCAYPSGGCSENWSCIETSCAESQCQNTTGELTPCHYCKPPE